MDGRRIEQRRVRKTCSCFDSQLTFLGSPIRQDMHNQIRILRIIGFEMHGIIMFPIHVGMYTLITIK
jgi:hypothetical protein